MKTSFINNVYVFVINNIITLVFALFIVWIHTLQDVPIEGFVFAYSFTLIYGSIVLLARKEFLTKISIDEEKITWSYKNLKLTEIYWYDIHSFKLVIRPTGRMIRIDYGEADLQHIYFYINRKRLEKMKVICPNSKLQYLLSKFKLYE